MKLGTSRSCYNDSESRFVPEEPPPHPGQSNFAIATAAPAPAIVVEGTHRNFEVEGVSIPTSSAVVKGVEVELGFRRYSLVHVSEVVVLYGCDVRGSQGKQRQLVVGLHGPENTRIGAIYFESMTDQSIHHPVRSGQLWM